MTNTILHETFDSPDLPPQLQWFNPPQAWHISDSALIINPDAQTDYWQRTNYGFRADNGHLLYTEVLGDFDLTTTARFDMVNQYDQVGLMVRFSPDCWLKTSVEYEPDEPNRLGAVITNHGWSDWSTQDFPDGVQMFSLRVQRRNGTYIVEYTPEETPDADTYWMQIRLAPLLEDDGQTPVQCGLYACSPKGAGFTASFDYIMLERGQIE